MSGFGRIGDFVGHWWVSYAVAATPGVAVTTMVDLTRDQAGCLPARLLDAVVGRPGPVYKRWLDDQPDGFVAGVELAGVAGEDADVEVIDQQ